MENVLLVCVNDQTKESAKSLVKAALEHNYSIEERDLIDNGDEIKFVFDDGTGGSISIDFTNENDILVIKIKADYPWEAIAVYELVASVFYSEDEV